jgi:hypothetical protein
MVAVVFSLESSLSGGDGVPVLVLLIHMYCGFQAAGSPF